MSHKQPITLIKLGGSIITNKNVEMVVRNDVLHRLVDEIACARETSPQLLIIGHGQGGFAHVPAKKYRTMDGFITSASRLGMALTQHQAAELNRIVVGAFLTAGMPAVSFYASNTGVTKTRNVHSWAGEVLREYLVQGMLPITGGDVMVDIDQGCTCWSTEQVLAHIAIQFADDEKYQVSRVIHVTEVGGVLDQQNNIIPHITLHNAVAVQKLIGKTNGFDVTGGMAHKLEESLTLARKGIDVDILSGLREDNLYHALTGKPWIGTHITTK